MKPAKLMAAVVAFACLCAHAALADGEHIPAVTDYARSVIRPWISDAAIVNAVQAQNARNAGLTQADIDALDDEWRAGVDGGDRVLIDSVLANPLSDLLRRRQIAANGVITEIIVMDDRGLNVGLSEVTSDYWQGDEAKWQKTFGTGDAAKIFVDDAVRDESTRMLQSQVSLTLSDKSGVPIGAITVGIDLNAL